MFGKQLSQYLGFQKVVLGLLAAVGLARLGLSLAGLPDSTVAWLSMNVVAWAGALYYGVAVHTRGFGSYKQILPLAFFQTLLQQSIAVLGSCSPSAAIRTSTRLPNSALAPRVNGCTSWPT